MASIEAQSLSSLTSLAANPPQYPRNPTHPIRDRLVLYIARVPGSRDVFLTPIKPREKVVSAEDVISCLYYIHAEQPEDDRLLRSEEEHQARITHQHATPHENMPVSPIRRRPLPPSPATSQYMSTLSVKSIAPLTQPWRDQLSPGILSVRTDVSNQANTAAGNFARKPVGGMQTQHVRANSDHASRTTLTDTSTPTEIRRRSVQPSASRTENPSHDRRLDLSKESDAFFGPARNYGSSPTVHGANGRQELMFRRKPPPPDSGASNADFAQPMVGRPDGNRPLMGLDADAGKASEARTSRTSTDQRMGQTEFGSPSTRLTLIRRDRGSSAQWNVCRMILPTKLRRGSSNTSIATLENRRADDENDHDVLLQVCLPGYRKFGTPLDPIDQSPLSDGARMPRPSVGHSPHQPQITKEEGDEVSLARWMSIGRPSMFNQSNNRIPKSIGYTFFSPWNGSCEFSTGAAGRSLKCRHVLQAADHALEPIQVSELRFNLPSTSVFGGPPTPSEEAPDGNKASSFFARPRHKKMMSSSSVGTSSEDVSKMDLTMGQEYAGGGFLGNKVKLGKLIIEDEGQKFLDLLVAANMALWWKAYERVMAD